MSGPNHNGTPTLSPGTNAMPRSKGPEPVRLNLDLSPATHVRLLRLRAATGAASQAEVVRKAIDVLDMIETNKAAGGTLLVRHADGTTRELILL